MYEYSTRVRYTEFDEQGRMRLLPLLNYLQDTSEFHGTDSGLSAEYYKQIGRAWFINYWDIELLRLPGKCEYILAGTSPHDIKGLFAYRNFWLKGKEAGDCIVRADSIWFQVDASSLRPVRSKPSDLAAFGTMENVLGIELDTRHVLLPEYMSEIGRFPVLQEMIDANHHVNNIRYIAAAHQALKDAGIVPSDYMPGHIRAEYKLAAKAGDTFVVYHHKENDRHLIRMESDDGRDFCHIEFSGTV